MLNIFYGCKELTSVTIPNSVTSIGKSAFADCWGLKSIVVDKDNPVYDSRKSCNAIIETANNTLIAGCTNASIPEGVTTIGESAFYECWGLTSITIPNSVTSIGKQAFFRCGLTSVTIPNSVTMIGFQAFESCGGLTSITIPKSVTTIAEDAFYDSPWYDDMKDGLIYINSIAYRYKGEMPPRTTLLIKDGTRTIGGSAFKGCSGLTSVTIPNSVTSIGEYVFQDCDNLTAIHCLCTTPPIVDTDECDAVLCEGRAFFEEGVDDSIVLIFPTLYVPRGSIEAYRKAKGWKNFQKIVEE